MNSLLFRHGITAALLLLAGGITGCAPQAAPPATPSQQQAMDRVDSIVAQSGGDWDKLSPADKQYFIEVRGRGREDIARALLKGMAARAHGGGRPLGPGAGPGK